MKKNRGHSSGRSTTGGPAVPYYISTPVIEAAKHLRLTVTRFLSERATAVEVDEAIEIFRAEIRRAASDAPGGGKP